MAIDIIPDVNRGDIWRYDWQEREHLGYYSLRYQYYLIIKRVEDASYDTYNLTTGHPSRMSFASTFKGRWEKVA